MNLNVIASSAVQLRKNESKSRRKKDERLFAHHYRCCRLILSSPSKRICTISTATVLEGMPVAQESKKKENLFASVSTEMKK